MNRFENQSVLITGATGLIGSNLAHRLMSFGNVRVVVLARNKDKITKLFSEYINNKNFEYIVQDITNPIKSEERFDYIFHAAGSIEGNIIRNCPVDIIKANIHGAVTCLEYLKKQNHGRMIVFSSATVYGNCNKERIVQEADTELTDSLDNPICAYSQSKRMAETLARAYYHQYGVDVVIARFSYVFGYSKYYPNSAIFSFIQKALNGEDIVINGINFQRRDNIYVEDAICMLLNVSKYGIPCEAYNISSGGKNNNYKSIDEIAQEIVNISNKLTRFSVKCIKKEFDDKDRQFGIVMNNSKSLAIGDVSIHDLTDALSLSISRYYDAMKEKDGQDKKQIENLRGKE